MKCESTATESKHVLKRLIDHYIFIEWDHKWLESLLQIALIAFYSVCRAIILYKYEWTVGTKFSWNCANDSDRQTELLNLKHSNNYCQDEKFVVEYMCINCDTTNDVGRSCEIPTWTSWWSWSSWSSWSNVQKMLQFRRDTWRNQTPGNN